MVSQSRSGTAYVRAGRETAPVIVLIHGLGLNLETWDQVIPTLSESYGVLSYDLWGHGKSARAPGTPSLRGFSEQLLHLIDELGIRRCVLVGFSLGGMINRRFAMDYPDRVAALGVLNSPHDRGPEAQKLVEERVAQTASGGPAATLDATIERWFTDAFRQDRPDVIETVRGWVLANDPEIYTQCRLVLARGVRELIRPDPPISVPTLVMTCQHDSGSTPAMTHAIASEISGARAIIVPRLKHMGLMEEPGLFTRPILQFLCDILTETNKP